MKRRDAAIRHGHQTRHCDAATLDRERPSWMKRAPARRIDRVGTSPSTGTSRRTSVGAGTRLPRSAPRSRGGRASARREFHDPFQNTIATRSARNSATLRSCEIKDKSDPICCCITRSRFKICACTETSRAETDSSAVMSGWIAGTHRVAPDRAPVDWAQHDDCTLRIVQSVHVHYQDLQVSGRALKLLAGHFKGRTAVN